MPAEPCALCGSTRGPDHICPGRAAELIGTTLDGRYLIEDVLGMGGMGMVYRGLQTSVKRPVAIKTLHAALAAAPEFFERFRREAETASRLIHPNIITIYDFGRTDAGVCYYVMELLGGQSLKQLVKQEGALSLRRATDIIGQTARGLGYAHSQNVVHRDVKPHNIMVQRLDGTDQVKVLDFGLVKAMEQDEAEQLTSTGQVLGTPQYMPPEQASGEPVDPRSDLFSLTGVLYFSLTTTSPFGANTIRKALMGPLTGELRTASSKRPGAPIPASLEEFFRKGLAAEKDDRFQNTDEFLEALHQSLGDLDASQWDARPTGPPPDTAGSSSSGKSSSRRITPSKPGGGKTHASGTAAPPLPPPRGRMGWVLVAVVVGVAIAGAVTWLNRVRSEARPPSDLLVHVDEGRPARPPPASEVVTVRLRSKPSGGDVFEGQLQLGETPIELRLPRGAIHLLSFQLKGYGTIQRALDLSHLSGDSTELEVAFEPAADSKRPSGHRKREDVPVFE